MTGVVSNISVLDIENKDSGDLVRHFINNVIDRESDETFAIVNLSTVIKKLHQWKTCFPNILFFYAIKAYDDEKVMRIVEEMGGGFDCASSTEVSHVLSLGIAPSRIIYANPIKPVSMLRYARERGVDLMTVDCSNELHKIAKHFPEARVVIRILPPPVKTVVYLGRKFGVPIEKLPELAVIARDLHLNVVGVSFHVGSPVLDPRGHAFGVQLAKRAFEILEEKGYEPTLLDIGGGFPGLPPYQSGQTTFEEVVVETNRALEKYFPNSTFRGRRIVIMAEPGQYLVFEAVTVVASIIGKKDGQEGTYRSFVDDEEILDPSSRKSIVDVTIDSPAIGAAAVDETHSQEERLASLDESSSSSSPTTFRKLTSAADERCRKTSLASNSSEFDLDEASSSFSSGGTSSGISSGSSGEVARGSKANRSQKKEHTNFIYYLSDGKYGTFSYLAYIEDSCICEFVKKVPDNSQRYMSTLYGPTCDGLDKVMENTLLPELEVGDWVFFRSMGAYTLVIGSEFNGFPLPRLQYVLDERHSWLLPMISCDRAMDWKLGRFRRISSVPYSCSECGSTTDLAARSGSLLSHSFPDLRDIDEALTGGLDHVACFDISVMANLGLANAPRHPNSGYFRSKSSATNGSEHQNPTAGNDKEHELEVDTIEQGTVMKRKGTLISSEAN